MLGKAQNYSYDTQFSSPGQLDMRPFFCYSITVRIVMIAPHLWRGKSELLPIVDRESDSG